MTMLGYVGVRMTDILREVFYHDMMNELLNSCNISLPTYPPYSRWRQQQHTRLVLDADPDEEQHRPQAPHKVR